MTDGSRQVDRLTLSHSTGSDTSLPHHSLNMPICLFEGVTQYFDLHPWPKNLTDSPVKWWETVMRRISSNMKFPSEILMAPAEADLWLAQLQILCVHLGNWSWRNYHRRISKRLISTYIIPGFDHSSHWDSTYQKSARYVCVNLSRRGWTGAFTLLSLRYSAACICVYLCACVCVSLCVCW